MGYIYCLLSPLLQVSVRDLVSCLWAEDPFFVRQFCAFSLLTCKLEQYSRIIKPLTLHYFSLLKLRSDTAPEYPHTVRKCISSIRPLWYRLRMSKRWQFVALGLSVRWTTLNEQSSKAVIFSTWFTFIRQECGFKTPCSLIGFRIPFQLSIDFYEAFYKNYIIVDQHIINFLKTIMSTWETRQVSNLQGWIDAIVA